MKAHQFVVGIVLTIVCLWPVDQQVIANPQSDVDELKKSFDALKKEHVLLLESLAELARTGPPLGTIVCSALDWEKFQDATNNNAANPNGNVWSSKYSMWAPADNRLVPDSAYAKLFNVRTLTVPDLRGVFVRGLNQFDPAESSHNARDPKTGRTAGNFEGDAFKSHDHGGKTGDDTPDHTHHLGPGYDFSAAYGNGNGTINFGAAGSATVPTSGANVRHHHSIGPQGDPDETRPKNVAVYYYIRIN